MMARHARITIDSMTFGGTSAVGGRGGGASSGWMFQEASWFSFMRHIILLNSSISYIIPGIIVDTQRERTNITKAAFCTHMERSMFAQAGPCGIFDLPTPPGLHRLMRADEALHAITLWCPWFADVMELRVAWTWCRTACLDSGDARDRPKSCPRANASCERGEVGANWEEETRLPRIAWQPAVASCLLERSMVSLVPK